MSLRKKNRKARGFQTIQKLEKRIILYKLSRKYLANQRTHIKTNKNIHSNYSGDRCSKESFNFICKVLIV